jgi:hypothetical protein
VGLVWKLGSSSVVSTAFPRVMLKKALSLSRDLWKRNIGNTLVGSPVVSLDDRPFFGPLDRRIHCTSRHCTTQSPRLPSPSSDVSVWSWQIVAGAVYDLTIRPTSDRTFLKQEVLRSSGCDRWTSCYRKVRKPLCKDLIVFGMSKHCFTFFLKLSHSTNYVQ